MSVIYVKVSTWLRTSSTIIIVPSAIALMPGILYYSFLFDILHINALNESGLVHMVAKWCNRYFNNSVGIAVGVAILIPNERRQKYLQNHLRTMSHTRIL